MVKERFGEATAEGEGDGRGRDGRVLKPTVFNSEKEPMVKWMQKTVAGMRWESAIAYN